MDNEKFISLNEKIRELNGHDRYLSAFSIGADSIASLLRVRELGTFDTYDGAILYYMFMFPDICWIDEFIEYIQKQLKIKIIQTPSPVTLECLSSAVYQNPHTTYGIFELQKTDNYIPRLKRDDAVEIMRDIYNIPGSYTSVGIKSGDSAQRRIYLRKYEGINESVLSWYPIWDFENRDVIEIIKRHGIKMSLCYRLSGISTEQIDHRFIEPLRKYYVQGYNCIKKYFPMIDGQRLRIERYKPEYIEPKKGVFYGKFECLYPDGYTENDFPIEKMVNKKTGRGALSPREFRKLFEDRWEFEGDMTSNLHIVFGSEKERSEFIKNKIKIVSDYYCFFEDVEKLFKKNDNTINNVCEFDTDFSVDFGAFDFDLDFDENEITEVDDGDINITEICKNEIRKQMVDIERFSGEFLEKNNLKKDEKYWITIIFEDSNKKKIFLDKYYLSDLIECGDILFYRKIKEVFG